MGEVEYTDQFGAWWDTLTEDEQVSVLATVGLLEEVGPAFTRPHADTIKGSKYPNMRELRIQHAGRPFRILYAFDPRRVAIMLIGGDTGALHTMRHKLSELRAKMSPENLARAHAATQELLAQMPLQQLRKAREMSQQTLADAMDVPQSAVSKIEQRTDAYVGTIRRYIEAMGGTLRIIAEFPDGGMVEIDQFAGIQEPEREVAGV